MTMRAAANLALSGARGSFVFVEGVYGNRTDPNLAPGTDIRIDHLTLSELKKILQEMAIPKEA
jgi:hypothetical protein